MPPALSYRSAAFAAFQVITTWALAGRGEPADLAGLDFEKLVELPVESVYGVSKYEQAIRQAPAGVTVLTAADIRNHGWRTLADALRSAPGFHIRNDRFYDYIGNRGFTRPYDYNSRTLVLVNGHRINDPIYQQGSVGTDFLLDLDLIDRIEIIRGPGSSVYGSSAFYGAINIIPKTGRDLAGGEASVAVDSTPGAKGRVSVGNRTLSGVEYLVSVTRLESRGEDNFKLPAAWRAATGSTAERATDDDGVNQRQLYAHIAWRGLETEAAYGRRHKEILPTVYDTLLDPTTRAVDERGYWLLRASGQPLPDATLEAKTSVDYYHFDGEFRPAISGFDRRHSTATSLSLNHEVRWHQTSSAGHSLLLGIEAQNNLRQKTSNPNLDTPSSSATPVDVTSYYFSPFAQLDYQLIKPLRLSLGARYDDYSTGESRLTPRAGLIWDVARDTTVKLLYGESFRVPNLEERYPTEPGGFANTALKPETNRSWELAIEHRVSPVWSVDTRFYRTISSGLITYDDTIPGTFTYVNNGEYATTGTELGVAARFNSGVQLRASTTLQETDDEATSDTVSDAPRLLAKLNASAPVFADWLRASAELHYVGRRHDFSTPRDQLPDYLVANLTVRAAPVWRDWELALSLYNVADSRWSDAKNVGQITNPPRTAVFKVTRDF